MFFFYDFDFIGNNRDICTVVDHVLETPLIAYGLLVREITTATSLQQKMRKRNRMRMREEEWRKKKKKVSRSQEKRRKKTAKKPKEKQFSEIIIKNGYLHTIHFDDWTNNQIND